MKRLTALLAVLALLAGGAPTAFAVPNPLRIAAPTLAQRVPGVVRFVRPAGPGSGTAKAAVTDGERYIVGLEKPAATASARVAASAALSLTGAHPVRTSPTGSFVVVEVPHGPAGKSTLSTLRSSAGVRYVEEVRRTFSASAIPDDPDYPDQWGMHAAGAHEAWSVTSGSPSVTVAVVDTGVEDSHPELAGHVVKGADWVDGDNNPKDGVGHGTHVAGIIGATADNGALIAGVAPGCTILAERVLDDSGFGTPESVALGIEDATLRGVDVINLSLGSAFPSPAVSQAIKTAQAHGILVVASAGNSGSSAPAYPASEAGVVSVAASNRDGTGAVFSNFGPTVDITAPGVDILSLWPLAGTATLSGTSMAAPVVSGTIALVMSKNPSLTPAQAADQVISTADATAPVGRNAGWGSGIVDAAAALGVDARLPDAGEPANDTTAGAESLPLGTWLERTLTGPADADVFALDLTAGHRYLLRTGLLMDVDTRIELLDETGARLAVNTDRTPGDPSSQLPFVAPTTGTYYVRVTDTTGSPARPAPTPGRYGVRATELGTAIVPEQLMGSSRYATAVNISKAGFPTGAPTVIVGTSSDYADVLASSALAGAWRAPILLVPPTGTVPSVVRKEIARLSADRAVILGGTGAVNAWVETQVKACLTGTHTIQRLAGKTRYDTASLIAREAKTRWSETRTFPKRAFLVSGSSWADGLLASPLAYHTGTPVMLTDPMAISPQTASAIRDMGITEVVVVGYDRLDTLGVIYGVFSQCPAVTSIVGCSMPDIPGTSVAVATYATDQLGTAWASPGFSSSWAYADSITAGPLLGERGSFLLMTPSSRLDGQVSQAVVMRADSIHGVTFLGGTGNTAGLEPQVRTGIMSKLQ